MIIFEDGTGSLATYVGIIITIGLSAGCLISDAATLLGDALASCCNSLARLLILLHRLSRRSDAVLEAVHLLKRCPLATATDLALGGPQFYLDKILRVDYTVDGDL